MIRHKVVVLDQKLYLKLNKEMKNKRHCRTQLDIPLEKYELIKDQIVLQLASRAERSVGFFGDIEVSMSGEKWIESIKDTQTFIDYMEDILFDEGHKIRVESVSGDHYILMDTVSVFEGDDNESYKNAIAEGISTLLHRHPIRSEIIKSVKDKVGTLISKEEVLKSVGGSLTEAVKDIKESTGLSYDDILGAIREE